jgi:hypothetical protein
VEAIAVSTGYSNSAVGSAAYSIGVATPTFSPVAGSYTGTQSVTISDATGGATIYYTTNGIDADHQLDDLHRRNQCCHYGDAEGHR